MLFTRDTPGTTCMKKLKIKEWKKWVRQTVTKRKLTSDKIDFLKPKTLSEKKKITR